MKITKIELTAIQIKLLKHFLDKEYKRTGPLSSEWAEDWTDLIKLFYTLRSRTTSGSRKGTYTLSLVNNEPWAIMNFLSVLLDSTVRFTKPRIYYRFKKLFQEILWQSSRRSNQDPEDWKWFVKSYYRDLTPQIRKY